MEEALALLPDTLKVILGRGETRDMVAAASWWRDLVGPAIATRMNQLGIHKACDLPVQDMAFLQQHFGTLGGRRCGVAVRAIGMGRAAAEWVSVKP